MYSINAAYFESIVGLPLDDALACVARAGFDALDTSPLIRSADWHEKTVQKLRLCEKHGLEVHQTHCPFFRYTQDKSEMAELIKRSYEGSILMGAKYFVVHGDEFDIKNEEYTPERALEYNYELFAPYVERAERDGICIAFETVFEDGMRFPRFTSAFDDLYALINKFGSDHVCCCWDFGHANVSFGNEQADRIRQMGSLLKCTHVHDNSGKHDSHLLPFFGNIDWPACRSAMHEIGYDGYLSLEMGYGTPPAAFGDTLAKYAFDTLVQLGSM